MEESPRVDVIAVVLWVKRVKSFNALGGWRHKDLLYYLQTTLRMTWHKQLWCKRHRNTEIWPQLVISRLVGRTIDVFINSTSFN